MDIARLPAPLSPVPGRARRARRVATFLAACSALFAVTVPVPAEAASAAVKSSPCPQRTARVVCVDQTHQVLWVQQAGRVVFSPVRVRTGKAGRRTPDGQFRIWYRNRHQYSYLFDEPMPFSLFFKGDYALHGSYGDIRKGGSNGCVNMTVADAARLFAVLDRGDVVYIWGHKPR